MPHVGRRTRVVRPCDLLAKKQRNAVCRVPRVLLGQGDTALMGPGAATDRGAVVETVGETRTKRRPSRPVGAGFSAPGRLVRHSARLWRGFAAARGAPPSPLAAGLWTTGAGVLPALGALADVDRADARGQIAELADQGVSDGRYTPDDSDHQQRDQQDPLEGKDTAAFAAFSTSASEVFHDVYLFVLQA
jgi:hypothetical protein